MPRRQPLRPDGNASNPNPTWSVRVPYRCRCGGVVMRCAPRRGRRDVVCAAAACLIRLRLCLGVAFSERVASAVFACSWSCCCSVLVSFDRCDEEFVNRWRWRQVLALGVCLHVLINNLTRYHHVGCLFHLGMWYCFYNHKLKQTRSFSTWVVTN